MVSWIKAKKILKNQSGQLAVEYVLLVVATVAIATIIVSELVRRDPENPGLVIQAWQNIVQKIGYDDAGEP